MRPLACTSPGYVRVCLNRKLYVPERKESAIARYLPASGLMNYNVSNGFLNAARSLTHSGLLRLQSSKFLISVRYFLILSVGDI